MVFRTNPEITKISFSIVIKRSFLASERTGVSALYLIATQLIVLLLSFTVGRNRTSYTKINASTVSAKDIN
jgi:hypothetical protein